MNVYDFIPDDDPVALRRQVVSDLIDIRSVITSDLSAIIQHVRHDQPALAAEQTERLQPVVDQFKRTVDLANAGSR